MRSECHPAEDESDEGEMGGELTSRRELRVKARRNAFHRPRSEWLLIGATSVGFAIGLIVTLMRETLVPEQFNRDAQRIFNIASGRVPDFRDGSYTPVGMVYRVLGLGENPDLAALTGYLLAAAVIVIAIVRSGRRTASVPVALYIVAAFGLSAVYLGQYSKDIFVLLPVALLILLPASIWWDILAIAAMLAYAYFFRDYWALVAIAYAAYRILVIRQVRLRYLFIGGAVASVLVGLAFHVAMGRDPNYYRTAVQDGLDANTFIVPLEPFAQPLGGAVDVFLNYWLIWAPLLLPITAGILYLAVLAGYAFMKVLPLVAARSSVRWPPSSHVDGSLVRRSLALLMAFAVVQAVFEPDYGSALRHLTPLMPLSVALMQASRSGTPRRGPSPWWSWSGSETTRERLAARRS